MKIQCENCAIQHELDPPSWVVSSGRAFRFRCSACGHSQSVQPLPPDTPVGADLKGSSSGRPAEASSSEVSASPASTEPQASSPRPAPTVAHPNPTLAPPDDTSGQNGASGESEAAVFLKQNGQIYMVRDWDTLKRWITEGRVDRHDLVSEGGVRWEPVGSRTDLLAQFPDYRTELGISNSGSSSPMLFARGPSSPLGGETPFGQAPADSAGDGWHDDDTEGIPLGLPPLPTDDIAPPGLTTTPWAPAAPDRTSDPAPPALLDEDDEPGLESGTSGPVPAVPDTTDGLLEAAEADEADLSGLPTRIRPAPPDLGSGSGQGLVVRPSTPARPPSTEEVLADTPEWTPPQRQGRTSSLLLMGLIVATFLVIVLGMWMLRNPRNATLPPTGVDARGLDDVLPRPAPAPPPPPDAPADPEPKVAPAPQPVAAADPAPPPEPVAAADAAPAPAPAPIAPAPVPVPPAPAPVAPAPAPVAPAPAPAPRPPAPSTTTTTSTSSLNSLIDQGWGAAERNPNEAARLFQQALDRAPADNEANYGYGYAMLQLGRSDQAQAHLCKARRNAPVDIVREVNGLLESHGLSCD